MCERFRSSNLSELFLDWAEDLAEIEAVAESADKVVLDPVATEMEDQESLFASFHLLFKVCCQGGKDSRNLPGT